MIRRTQHSLKDITGQKREHLDSLFSEYAVVVNKFIQLLWNEKKLPSKPNATQWRQVQSWLCGKTMKCAYRQAVQAIKSAQDKNKKLIYKKYQKVYFKAKTRNKNWSIVNQKWSDWSKDRVFRNRVSIPVFKGDSIDLNSDLVRIYPDTKMKLFDLAVRLGSIWGNRLSVVLPTNKHKRFNKFVREGYELNSSIQLRRINGQYYLNLFHEKETPKVKTEGEVLGIDIGLKKMMSTSDGRFYGQGRFESLIKKLHGRQCGSKNHAQTILEIKDYIGNQVNQIVMDDLSVIVIEDLNLASMQERNGRNSKSLRKKLGSWNARLLFGRLRLRTEENRVLLASVEPEYTSQQCSICGAIHKESRKGERYECIECGGIVDADTNGGRNIRSRFLGRAKPKGDTVPCERKQESNKLGSPSLSMIS
jgi:IS605 OrfB family transposase